MYSVKDIVVITGAGGALCSSFALELGRQGKRIAVLDMDSRKARAVADQIVKSGGEAVAVCCDVTSKQSILKAREAVRKALGKCTILINGAGINHPRASTSREYYEEGEEVRQEPEGITNFFTLDPGAMEKVIAVNFMGTFLCSQVFAEDMIGQQNATIINISSMNATEPMTKVPAYAASKAAVSNLTKWLAVYLADAKIRVNAIAPGFYLTDVNKDMYIMEDGSTSARYKKVISHTPMRRFGHPDELLGTLTYLCDYKMSGYVTGTILPVDGGFLAYSGV